MADFPYIILTEEMIDSAKMQVGQVKVNRTIASKIDTLTGILGEYSFAEYFYGDWRKNRVGKNKGDVNFHNIEIKTSSFPFNNNLHLLVREDYADKRKPPFYIQIIIDVESPNANIITPGTKTFICGFASASEVDSAPKRDFGSKFGGAGNYKCHYIKITALHPMSQFEKEYRIGEKEHG